VKPLQYIPEAATKLVSRLNPPSVKIMIPSGEIH